MRRFFVIETPFFVRPRACFHCGVFRVPKNGTLKTNKPPAMQVVGIALALCKKTSLVIIKIGSPTVLLCKGGRPNGQ